MDEAWRAPEVERGLVELTTEERLALEQWTDFHRATLLSKCAGLSGSQLAEMAVPPSNLSLLGLVRHMAEVERSWFRHHVSGEEIGFLYCSDEHPDGDFELVEAGAAESDIAAYEAEVRASREAAATHELDEEFASRGHHPERIRNLRWIYLHMIEEYARHNGHADLLRQAIDGATGL